MRSIDIADGKVTGERETDDGIFGLEATLPAIVSISEKIVDDARFPSFKGIMAAKKKPVETLTLAGIGVEADEVGGAVRRLDRGVGHPEAAEDGRREGHRRGRGRQADRRLPRRSEAPLSSVDPSQTHTS